MATLNGLPLHDENSEIWATSTNSMKVNGELAARALNEKALQYYLAAPDFQIYEYEYWNKEDENGEPIRENRYAFGNEFEGKFQKEGLTFDEMNSLLAEYQDIDLQDRAEQNLLNENEFREYVADHIKEFLPEEFQNASISLNETIKNNDTVLHGIIIKNDEDNIAPIIYLESFFERYENGAALNSIMTDISDSYKNNLNPDIDISYISDYEKIKDKISFKLLNKDFNKEYLSDKAMSEVNDFAMSYKVNINEKASIPISKNLLENWNKSVDDIKSVALDNIAKEPYEFRSIAAIFADKMGLPLEMIEAQMPDFIYVLSNESGINGASVILNDKAMTEISDRFNDDLIIIPSSIHECIVIPSRSAEIPNLDSLNEIINSVNANELTPDEILSDKAYGYDKNTHELIHADQLSVFKSVEQTLEQNDNMLDGIINNGANAREIPGTYDEAEREADELTRAKKLISEYSKDEFGNEPDFSDLKSIGLAYTTIDNFEFLKEAGVENFNKEFEIQVDANLIDNEIITYIDGDEISTEKFESLADMLPTLESLNFNDLIHLGSEGWEKIAESELNREAQEALDAHEAEFGADGSRVFPHLNDEPEDKTDVFLYPEHTNDDTKAISDFLSDKGIDYRFVSVNNADVVRIDRENLNTLTEILANRDINFAIEPEEALAIQIDQLNRDFDTYAYDDNVESRNEAVSEIYSSIMSGNFEHLYDVLNGIIESEDSPSVIIANNLIGELQDIENSQLDLEMDALKNPDQELSSDWEQINHKMVYDSDGMMTDYTMYHNTVTDEYASVFGDKDIYRPEDRIFDWEGSSLEEANEWFESYDSESMLKDDIDLVGDKNLNFDEFKAYVQDHIKEHLPEEYANATVKLQEVVKNNDNTLSGVCIQKEDSNIAPNIYLESFFEKYENGAELAQILDNIADIRVKNEPELSFDVSNLTDIFKVRDKIIPVLISEEMNKEYLADKPYTTVSDMAVVYKINLGGDSDGRMSAPVTNQLLDSYGISKEELKDIAFANLSEQEMDFMTMREMLAKMMGIDLQDLNDPRIAMLPPDAGIPMYILSNQEKINGASAMLSDKVMDNIAEKLGGDFVVIPSSIHEVIILPINPEIDKVTLEGMISDVNNSQVAPEERLSYNLYGYNAEEHKLVLASELPFFREENIVKDNPVVDVPTNEENKSQSEKNLADKVQDAILEAGGVSEKEKKEPLKIKISDKLIGEPHKTKDGRMIVRVKIPNADGNKEKPWDSFVVSTHDIEKTGDGKANISLTPDGTHKIYSPKIIGTDENGKTMFENTETRVSNADIKARFDALSVEQDITSFQISEKLVSDPFKSENREFVSIKVPNEDKNDKSPWATIVIPSIFAQKSDDGKVNIHIPENLTFNMSKSVQNGLDEAGNKIYEKQDAGKITVSELKKRCEHKVNLKDMIKTNKEASKELKLRGTEFIVQLPKEMQDKIKDAISKVEGADVKTAMDGRLTDLEDNIDWRKVLDIKPDNPFTKDHSAR